MIIQNAGFDWNNKVHVNALNRGNARRDRINGVFNPWAIPDGNQNEGRNMSWHGNANQLAAQNYGSYWDIPTVMNNWLVNGYMGFGDQMQGAMGQIGNILNQNAWRNVANNQTEAQYQAARVPIEEAQINANAQTAKLEKLSPLLDKLFSGLCGMLGGGQGGGGMSGFRALDPNGNQFASGSFGAQATDTNRYARKFA